jgi:hypothetical protein
MERSLINPIETKKDQFSSASISSPPKVEKSEHLLPRGSPPPEHYNPTHKYSIPSIGQDPFSIDPSKGISTEGPMYEEPKLLTLLNSTHQGQALNSPPDARSSPSKSFNNTQTDYKVDPNSFSSKYYKPLLEQDPFIKRINDLRGVYDDMKKSIKYDQDVVSNFFNNIKQKDE